MLALLCAWHALSATQANWQTEVHSNYWCLCPPAAPVHTRLHVGHLQWARVMPGNPPSVETAYCIVSPSLGPPRKHSKRLLDNLSSATNNRATVSPGLPWCHLGKGTPLGGVCRWLLHTWQDGFSLYSGKPAQVYVAAPTTGRPTAPRCTQGTNYKMLESQVQPKRAYHPVIHYKTYHLKPRCLVLCLQAWSSNCKKI